MKKIVLIFAAVGLSFTVAAQDKINLEFQMGYFMDQDNDDGLNAFSPDMSSNPDVQDNELSSRFTVNYNMSDKLSFDLIYGNGNSRGNNDVEMYVTEFTEVGLSANYLVYSQSKIDVFLNAGMSKIDFNSERTLMSGSEIPHSVIEDESDVRSYGAKIRYTKSDKMYMTLSYSVYNIDNDGFDGWDNGSDSDELVYTGIGIGFNLK